MIISEELQRKIVNEYLDSHSVDKTNGFTDGMLKAFEIIDKIEKEKSELEESNRNGMDWFNAYQDIDNFLFDELYKKGLEFITEFEKPELNTIASIKLLMCNCG